MSLFPCYGDSTGLSMFPACSIFSFSVVFVHYLCSFSIFGRVFILFSFVRALGVGYLLGLLATPLFSK